MRRRRISQIPPKVPRESLCKRICILCCSWQVVAELFVSQFGIGVLLWKIITTTCYQGYVTIIRACYPEYISTYGADQLAA